MRRSRRGYVHLLQTGLLCLGAEHVLVFGHGEARVEAGKEREDDAVAERDEREGAHIDLARRGRRRNTCALAVLRRGRRTVRFGYAVERREERVGL